MAITSSNWKKMVSVFCVSATILFTTGCVMLPNTPPQPESLALSPAASGPIADARAAFYAKNGHNVSGFYPLSRNDEAMKMRLALVTNATTSIDIKYFIWQGDEMSDILFVGLYNAADRGVRIRMIVDDLGMAANDSSLAAISKHTNIEIKLYNPGRVRSGALGPMSEFLLRFRQLNRRMHNKLMIIDGHMAIVGGRNIGSPYFGASSEYNFRDFDAIVTGPVLGGIRESFDEYWNAEISYPTKYIKSKISASDMRDIIEARVNELTAERHRYEEYLVDAEQWRRLIAEMPLQMTTGVGTFLQDYVTPVDGSDVRLIDMIGHVSIRTDSEITLVSPYLIPSDDFMVSLNRLTQRGVRVRLITASMASNNHTIAHSHYKKYRKRLIQSGAELYEFKPHPSQEILAITDVPPVKSNFISLHTKALVSDKENCFIGSLNFDPRAVEINTENGMYISSKGFCGDLAKQLNSFAEPQNAWRVTLNEKNKLRWTSGDEVLTRQPARSTGQRVADFFYRLLPIESQL